MKKIIVIALVLTTLCFALAACGSDSSDFGKSTSQGQSGSQAVSQQGETAQGNSESAASSNSRSTTAVASTPKNKVAKDDANMQTQDKSMPTRIPPENGTRINMYFGDTLIPGVLNDSETARALIAKLPLKQHVSRYSHDFCGVTQDLPYSAEDVHYGWLNGDIDYATDVPYFTILFEDEDVSEQYGSQVNIGVITCPLADIAALKGDFDIRIELAD